MAPRCAAVHYIRLQPPSHTVAASVTYGCSLRLLRPSHSTGSGVVASVPCATLQVVTAVSVGLPLAANLKLFRASLGRTELAANVRPICIHMCIHICIHMHTHITHMQQIHTHAYELAANVRPICICICICSSNCRATFLSIWTYACTVEVDDYRYASVLYGQVVLLGAAAVFAAWGTHSGLQEVGLL